MHRAVIIDIVRSPFGKGRETGVLAPLHPVDLYAQILSALVDRTGIDPILVEDVITGCVNQVAEQAANIGRQAVLAAGFPESVPAVSLDRKCGSAQQAMDFAAQGIIAGAYDLVIAGGVEMMSRVPMRTNRMGKDNLGSRFHSRYPDGMVNQGISAELIAAQWHISREELDRFSLRSHQLASADEEDAQQDIIPVEVQYEDARSCFVTNDEGIRADTSMEKLRDLSPAFVDEEVKIRFPQIDWCVTAGNSSQVTDGASAMLIANEETAARLGLEPRAAITHFAVVGSDPVMNLTGIMPATNKLLSRADLNLDKIDAFEVNEAFASVVLAWQKELSVDISKVNQRGGAIALGHPVGASGGRLTANLLRTLESNKAKYGLQTMCESGGLANATLIEIL